MRGKLQDFRKLSVTIRRWIMSPDLPAVRGEQRDDVYHAEATRRTQRNGQQIIDRLRVKLAKEPGANLS